MRYIMVDYNDEYLSVVEKFFDREAMNFTGCDNGWNDYFEYFKNDPMTVINKNFWAKVILDGHVPVGIIAVSCDEDLYRISEFVISPDYRGKGIGSLVLCDLLENSEEIVGGEIKKVEACIFPNNIASQKVFEKAGFKYDRAHPDGDTWYYVYER